MENTTYTSNGKKNYLPLLILISLTTIIVFLLFILFIPNIFFPEFNNKLVYKPLPKDAQKPVTAAITTYPTAYNGQLIPEEFYMVAKTTYQDLENEQIKLYLINMITRFYIYKDILEENNIDNPLAKKEISLTTGYEDVEAMEELILTSLYTNIDFGYIKARFRAANYKSEEEIKQRYTNQKTIAKKLIDKYRKMIEENPNHIKEIINQSNKDNDLMLINNQEKNAFIEKYNKNKLVFFPRDLFNEFLFKQNVDKLSETYEIEDDFGPYAYLIVYPTKITYVKNNPDDLDTLLKNKLNLFTYN